MKKTLVFSLFLVPLLAMSQSYKKLHQRAIVIDTHNDFPTQAADKGVRFDQNLKGKTHSDLQRMKEGGMDIQVFSIFCDGGFGKGAAYKRANQEIDSVYAWVERNPSAMMLVKTPSDLQRAVKEKKLGAMMGVEGGHMIEDDLQKLDQLFERGVRYMTLTWNNSTAWATSAADEVKDTLPMDKRGLTALGKQIVQRMNELGMIVDVSHVGERTFWDAIATTTKPVIASHSCVHAICPVSRNLKDDQLKAIAKNDGVVHLNFYSGFLDSGFNARNNAFLQAHKAERDSLRKINPEPYYASQVLFEKYPDEVKSLRPPLSLLLDHLDYIVRLIGVDHVGLGSDFDGISSSPQQLDDVTGLPLITKALLERGYKKKDIQKILGGNFIRVFKANMKS